MALTEVVRFMRLSNELTDKEFYGSFCKSVGRELIVSLLYQHFKNNLDAAKHAADIQSKIMNKRKKIKDKASTYERIDKLPSQIISECGSFLHFKDYFRFGHCNRNIYYSLYSPSKIYEIDTFDIQKCDNLAAFKNVKSLVLGINEFLKFTPANKAIWSNDESLEDLVFYGASADENDLKLFVQNLHFIDNRNVKHLTLCNVPIESTMKILSRFDKIERLNLQYIYFSESDANDVSDPNLWTNLSNLRHIELEEMDKQDWILEKLSKQLESVTFCDNLRMTNVVFPKLRKLDGKLSSQVLSAFNHVDSLQEIKFVVPETELVDPLFLFISKQKQLQSLSLLFSNRPLKIDSAGKLKEIEASLLNYAIGAGMNHKLSIYLSFKLFRFIGQKQDIIDEFGLHVFRVINALSARKSTNWKLQIKYERHGLDSRLMKLNVLETLQTKYLVQIETTADALDIMIESP